VAGNSCSGSAAASARYSKASVSPVHSSPRNAVDVEPLTTGDGQSRSEPRHQRDDIHGELVTCCLDELRAHPSYVHLGLAPSVSNLSALAEQGQLAFREPLIITWDRVVIDGYARWKLARQQGQQVLPCIEYELNEEESLRWLIQRHCRSKGLNAFCRIRLALELEPHFRAKALSNQRVGGQQKGSSKLTEAQRVDVRHEIAGAAGVSAGNVSKVRELMNAPLEIVQALIDGEISIHRAWVWSRQPPAKQIEKLRLRETTRGINKAIEALLSQHVPKVSPTIPDVGTLVKGLSALDAYEPGSVGVAVIKVPGRRIFLSEDLLQDIGSQGELPLR
jgi:hypothetical protein